MTSKLNPYLSFKGNTKEVIEFYKDVFGGTLTMSTYKEGGMSTTPETENHIMHAMLVAENGITLMASDMPDVGGMDYIKGTNINISLSGDNVEELSGYYNKLAVGGMVVEPLAMSPWGDVFGMVTDKFGIFWMVNIIAKK